MIPISSSDNISLLRESVSLESKLANRCDGKGALCTAFSAHPLELKGPLPTPFHVLLMPSLEP